MKKLPIYFLSVIVCLFVGCSQNNNIESIAKEEPKVSSRILKFPSKERLGSIISEMQAIAAEDIRELPATRTSDVEIDEEQFVSLRQHLIEQGLRSFSNDELAEIIADSLEYEPEDSLIVDPYLMCLLNENREVQIDNKIYKYINEGVIVYNVTDPIIFDASGLVIDSITCESLEHGDIMKITDHNGVQAELIALTYAKPDVSPFEEYRDGYIDTFGGDGGGIINDPYEGVTRSVTMIDETTIPQEKVNILVYKNDGHTGSWLNDLSTSLFGLNLTITNKFNSRHRMKLRLYSQDYWIYKATGMTVRMQKRTLGIWWRKKAQEFRYGWTAMECKYSFKIPVFKDPTPTPEGYTYGKYPTAMRKNFPFAKKDIVLFHIPIANYDVKTGDINKVFSLGMKEAAKQIEAWFSKPSNKKYEDHPWGLYTYKPTEENKLLVVYPQGEECAYGKGREVVKWDANWFSGTYTIGYTSTLSGGGFSVDDFEFKVDSPSKLETIRGRVHAAVRFNDEWRACAILTM